MGILTGTLSNDSLTGGMGEDIILGSAGDDTLNGGQGQIKLVSSYPYNDYDLDSKTDGDIMIGGSGDDVYIVTATNSMIWASGTYVTITNFAYDASIKADIVIERFDEGIDSVVSFVSYTLPDNVENLELANGFYGVGKNGTGNSLNNQLFGNDDKNVLSGKDGDDTLIGGLGNDQLTGGKGNDIFVVNDLTETGIGSSKRDIITDFVSAQDKIDLSAIDANESSSGKQGFTSLVVGENFSARTTFHNPGELYFDNIARILYGNTNTDSAPEFSIQLNGVNTITIDDLMFSTQ